MIYWIPAFAIAGIIFALSSIPGSGKQTFFLFPHSDKVAHFGIYGILAVALFEAFRRTKPEWSRSRLVWTTWILIFLYGVSDEVHQSFVPHRSVEALDLLADICGGVVVLMLWLFVRRTCKVSSGQNE